MRVWPGPAFGPDIRHDHTSDHEKRLTKMPNEISDAVADAYENLSFMDTVRELTATWNDEDANGPNSLVEEVKAQWPQLSYWLDKLSEFPT